MCTRHSVVLMTTLSVIRSSSGQGVKEAATTNWRCQRRRLESFEAAPSLWYLQQQKYGTITPSTNTSFYIVMNGSSPASPPLSNFESQAWEHLCETLTLDQDPRAVFQGLGIKCVVDFYAFMLERQENNVQDKMFDFDNENKISFANRVSLKLAWEWLHDHYETVEDAGTFCHQFTHRFKVEALNNKRKRLEEKEQEKKMKTQASQMSASNFTSDTNSVLEGVGSMPPYVYKHMIPSQVKRHFLSLLGDSLPTDRIVIFQKELRKHYVEGFELKSRGEATGDRSVQVHFLDSLANPNDGLFQKRMTTERIFNDCIPSKNRRTLEDLGLAGGVATQSTPPDGHFHTRELNTPLETREHNFLVTGLVECKGSESSAFRGFGEVVASATNAAVALYRVGLASDRIVIPVVSMTGMQAVFGAVYLLEPCFPAFCFLTKPLSFYEDQEETAKYFLGMLEYTRRMEHYIEEIGVEGLRPRTTNPYELMELDKKKYFMKDMENFFLNSSGPAESIDHFLRTTEKLVDHRDFFCLPITIRLGETKGANKKKHFIIFERLVDFNMGFPENHRDREKLLEGIIGVASLLHRLGVIHMDLYLSNIMWKKNHDGKLMVTLVDFDASQLKGDSFTSGVLLRLNKTPELLGLVGADPASASMNCFSTCTRIICTTRTFDTSQGNAQINRKRDLTGDAIH